MSIQENALQDARFEWIEESTFGEAPSDPSWNRFSDYIADAPGWDGGPDISEGNAVGSGDIVEITRGAEEHTITVEYWLQRALVDGSGNVQDPVSEPFVHDYDTELNSHSIQFRREVTEGGNDSSGFRMYTVGLGCKPVSATIPGDPGESQPQAPELEYQCHYARSHVIHQPSAGTTLDVSNAGTTSVDVTIEDEGASTTETVTVAGGSTTTTTESFSDIDVIWIASGTPDGKITVTDGSGTTLLEDGLAGTGTEDPDYEKGIPPLGSGSHGGAIGNDPERYLGLNSDIQRGGSSLADRVHSYDLSAEIDASSEPVVGSRMPEVDAGTRTVSVDTDVAGPFESTSQLTEFFRGTENDVVLSLGGDSSANGTTDITLGDAAVTDVDEQSYGAGDENFIFGVTFTAQDKTGNAVSVTNTT